MGLLERRAKQKAEFREKILIAARDLIRESGYQKLTIRAIADRIEYSPMVLYSHFPDKDAILTELAEDGFAELVRKVPSFDGLPPLDALRGILLAYIAFGVENPEQYRIVFMTEWRGPANNTTEIGRQSAILPLTNGRAAFTMLVDLVQRCAEVDSRFTNVFETASLLWAGIHGATSLLITMRQFPFGPAGQFAEKMADLLLAGVVQADGKERKEAKAAEVPLGPSMVRKVLQPSLDETHAKPRKRSRIQKDAPGGAARKKA